MQSATRQQAFGNHAALEPPRLSRCFDRVSRHSRRSARHRNAAAEVDVVIIGAGAAGIAAARRIAAAGRKFVLIEASDHIGGRCITETRTFGVPYDRGAHWIHVPDFNPVTKLTARRGLEVYPAPAESESADRPALRARGRAGGFSGAAGARQSRDRRRGAQGRHCHASRRCRTTSANGARPIEFAFGPYVCGKDLAQIVGCRFCKVRRARHRRILPAGFRRADRELRRRTFGQVIDSRRP